MAVYVDHSGFAIDSATAEASRADMEVLLPSFVHNRHVLELG